MPHLVILYTGNLDAETDMSALCQSLAGTLLAAILARTRSSESCASATASRSVVSSTVAKMSPFFTDCPGRAFTAVIRLFVSKLRLKLAFTRLNSPLAETDALTDTGVVCAAGAGANAALGLAR